MSDAEDVTEGHARIGSWFVRTVGAPRRFFALCLILTFLNLAVWSIATPLFASPDEPTQIARAAAVVRGELVGRTVGSTSNGTTAITIPAVFASGPAEAACYAFHPTVAASCAPSLPTSTKPVHTTTYAGRYPPLYYLVVGLPSLVWVSEAGIYLMRLTSALVNGLFIALALFAVRRWSGSRLLLVGVLTATTPMVWFLGSVVNPSGLEICAAICLWTSGAVLVLERADHPPPGLVAIVAVSLGALVLTRPLSPLWAALIVCLLALAGGWRAVAGIVRSRAVKWAVLPLLACGAFAMWWIASKHALDLEHSTTPVPQHETSFHLLGVIIGHTWFWAQQMVGVFGWLDTFSPAVTYVVWFAVVGIVFVLALVALGRPFRPRATAALVLLVLAVLALPVAIADSQVHRLGIVWQGRDILPVAVGIPVLSVALFEHARGARRQPLLRRNRSALVVGTVCTALGVAELSAFSEALRRYTVGVTGPVDFLNGSWQPPLSTTGSIVLACAVVVLLLAWSAYWQSQPATLTELERVSS